MRCIWLEDKQLDIREIGDPKPSTGEALIRVRLAGIVATARPGAMKVLIDPQSGDET